MKAYVLVGRRGGNVLVDRSQVKIFVEGHVAVRASTNNVEAKPDCDCATFFKGSLVSGEAVQSSSLARYHP